VANGWLQARGASTACTDFLIATVLWPKQQEHSCLNNNKQVPAQSPPTSTTATTTTTNTSGSAAALPIYTTIVDATATTADHSSDTLPLKRKPVEQQQQQQLQQQHQVSRNEAKDDSTYIVHISKNAYDNCTYVHSSTCAWNSNDDAKSESSTRDRADSSYL